ncbi:UDP-glycosyltransferase 73B4-like [Phoenix dactylifera]|uniref:Glycosyltransferase n=1 Tax=Phoenix dactylifera TaxID=42345 RepID=A0A8B7C962_PHODC|nr:UDP-glycosyltransferase 73B4-like [Phoenix dactylifera]
MPPTATSATSAGMAAQETERDHVVIFPFMAKGHTIPLLHLAAALSARGLRVTLVTTPANSPFIRRHLPTCRHPAVAILTLPFPHLHPLPPGVESTDVLPSLDLYPAFLRATGLLRRPFHHLLVRLLGEAARPPLCLISDFFLGWTLPLCRRFGLPRLVFHGMSTFSMALCKSLWVHQPHSTSAASGDHRLPFHVPGTPPSLLLTLTDVPDTIRNSANPDDPVTQYLNELGDSDVSSWGIVVNSFAAVDGDYVRLLESFYLGGARACLVGPLSLLADIESDAHECLKWLDGKDRGSVVFVSFGTQVHVPVTQLHEVAHGLVQSGHSFVWVVRSETWAPPDCVQERGKIVRGWVPQREILGHVAVGGFVSHCGWNSVLESLSAGVPILAWPMIAEQRLNAKHVVELLGAGVLVGAEAGEIIGREEVAKGVKEVMGGGEKGWKAREGAAELRQAAAAAVAEGGTSDQALEELLEELRRANSNVIREFCKEEDQAVVAEEATHADLQQDGIQIS